MIESFQALIRNIHPLTVITALYGILMITAAFSKHGTGAFYFNAFLSMVSSVIIHLICGGSIAEIFYLLLFMLIVVTAVFILSIRMSKYGWIIRTPLTDVSKGVKQAKLQDKEN